MRKELAVLLFNHDGTLVDSEVVHYKIWQSVLTDFNIPLPFNEFIINYIGISSLETSSMPCSLSMTLPPLLKYQTFLTSL